MSSRPVGGDDFTLTSTWTQKHRQVPVAGASYSNVEGFQSEPRPGPTSAVDSRFRRTQSSTAVYQTADSARQNGPVIGAYSLGSTYDEGDYDPVDSMRAGIVTTPLTTSSLHRQTTTSSSGYTLQPPQQQQQQQLTEVVRRHRRTQSTGLTDFERCPPTQAAYNNSSAPGVLAETDRGGFMDGLDNRTQQAGHRIEETQRQSTTRRQVGGNVMVVSNAGYEPTTLEHRTPQKVVVQSLAAVNSASTAPMLNGDAGRHQSSVRYDQNTTVLHQQVQRPSYATIHRVQQSTSPGASMSQRAVIVDAAQLLPQQQQQQQQQREMLLKQHEEEKRQLQQRSMMTLQSDIDQHQPRDQLQHQVVMRRQQQQAVVQNVATSPSRSTQDRLLVNQVGKDDGRNRLKSSTMTTTTSQSLSGTMSNGHPRSTSRTVQVIDRRQSPSYFSTNSNSQSGDSGSQSAAADDFTVKRADLVGGGGRGDLAGPAGKRGGGADTPSSVSSAASRRSPATVGGTQQRFSTASSSGTTEPEHSDSSLDRASSLIGETSLFIDSAQSRSLLFLSLTLSVCLSVTLLLQIASSFLFLDSRQFSM